MTRELSTLESRDLDSEDMEIFARDLDINHDMVLPDHAHMHPLPVLATSYIGSTPFNHASVESTYGIYGFLLGVVATMSVVMVHKFWRRFSQGKQAHRQYKEAVDARW